MSAIEYEAKHLDIDPQAMTAHIAEAGGKHVGDQLMRRYVYDTLPAVAGRWIRLRDTGRAVTLCVKEITSDEIDGTSETETTVGDFETAHALLGRMGIAPRSYQENHRSSWLLDGVRLEIDSWPLIPPYLEIEGDDAEHVRSTARRLSIPADSLTSENTTKIYARYGIDLETVADLRFPAELRCGEQNTYL
ncbi:CYTH domain-containing protein [Streptomyces sp. NBC_01471]|uniref:class IV adenylate cyclase n=1 Tax=Streptomyces sp. NBC_01471 TaxID=2903879 RepID=UPI00324C724B